MKLAPPYPVPTVLVWDPRLHKNRRKIVCPRCERARLFNHSRQYQSALCIDCLATVPKTAIARWAA